MENNYLKLHENISYVYVPYSPKATEGVLFGTLSTVLKFVANHSLVETNSSIIHS